MSDFVVPNIQRLPLSKGRWIDVKTELNAGEYRKMIAAQIKDYAPGTGRPILDPEQVGRSKVSAYLLGWSLAAPLSEAAIDNLKTGLYKEIVAAIDAHEARVEADEEKNENDGALKSAAISPSVN